MIRRLHPEDDKRQNNNNSSSHNNNNNNYSHNSMKQSSILRDEEMVSFLEDSYPQSGPMSTEAILNTVASGKYSPRSGKISRSSKTIVGGCGGGGCWHCHCHCRSRATVVRMSVLLTALCAVVFVATGRSYSESAVNVVASYTTAAKSNATTAMNTMNTMDTMNTIGLSSTTTMSTNTNTNNDNTDDNNTNDTNDNDNTNNKDKDNNGIPSFECPSHFELQQETEQRESAQYSETSKEMTSDQTEFLSTFRDEVFDAWDETYTAVKDGLAPFKSKYYPRHLREGMTLYESAMGIGLNLFLTLELLAEQTPPITGITVYGNDFVAESIEQARTVVLAEGVIPEGNAPGIFCAGNSLDLGHVPSEAFDLVYTGYLSPLQDPLHLEPNANANDDEAAEEWDWEEYDAVCEAVARQQKRQNKDKDKDKDKETKNMNKTKNKNKNKTKNKNKDKNKDKHHRNNKNKNKNKDNTDWMGAYLWDEIMVPQQRDWHGKWVAEMTRIAKPGVPVMVESVSVPYCDNRDDWGGVVKSFWEEAARENTYNWNVDPDSIEIMDDDTLNDMRYHVFMMKKRDNAPPAAPPSPTDR